MKAEDPKQPRQPWRFTVDGGEPFAFAGICTRKEWEDEEDRGFDDGWLYSCTIVTTTPNEVVAPVHNRMPAILPSAEAEAAWLRPDLSVEDAVAMCGPLDARRMSERPGQPEAEQGRQRDGGRARSCWSRRRPADASARLLRFRFLFGFFALLLRLAFFGFFVDRRRELAAARPRCWTVASPALVVSVQAIFAAGDRGRLPDRVEGQLEVLLRLAAGEEVFEALGARPCIRPFELDALFGGEARRQVVDFERPRVRCRGR